MSTDDSNIQLPIPLDSTASVDLDNPAVRAAIDAYKLDIQTHSLAENTITAYEDDWQNFCRWCDRVGIVVATLRDAESVERALLLYATYHLYRPEKPLTPSTVGRRLTGIRAVMLRKGLPHPAWPRRDSALGAALRLAERQLHPQVAKATAISESLIRQMAHACDPTTYAGKRDRALLLVGFCGAFRRSEIVRLELRDLRFEAEGLVIHLRYSKTDQSGHGRDVYLPFGRHHETCPVRSTQRWIEARGDWPGPLFTRTRDRPDITDEMLNTATVDAVVKRYVRKVGAPGHYSAHSLRSGLATSAARAGASLLWIQRQTGHRSTQSVEGYIQAGTGFQHNVMRYLDL